MLEMCLAACAAILMTIVAAPNKGARDRQKSPAPKKNSSSLETRNRTNYFFLRCDSRILVVAQKRKKQHVLRRLS